MKKNFFYLLMVAFCVTIAFLDGVKAQNGSPYWSLAGNSNAAASSKLGTTNGIPLRLFTNNAERIRITPTGQVGIGITTPVSIVTIRSSGSGTPVSSWLNAISSPIITGFSDGINGELNINTASSAAAARRAVFQGKRSRGTLTAPSAVINNDYLLSFVSSGYDGSAFQNPATIDFYVDGTPSAGNVPGRISFVTGTNTGNRQERLVIKSNGNVGIGTTSPSNKLDVIGRGQFSDGLSVSESGIYSNHSTGNGIEAYANTTYGIGALGSGYYGVYGSGAQYGVYGQTTGGNAVYGYNSSTGIGVTGYSESGSGVYGISDTWFGVYGYTATGSYAGYFSGNVYSTGTYQGSDRNLKKDITDVTSAMDIINKLKPKSYSFRQDGNYKLMNMPAGKHYGLIAQEVEEVLPNLVKATQFETKMAARQAKPDPGSKAAPAASQTSETIDFKALNYTELIPIVIKGMQEQAETIKQQQEQINELKKLVSTLTKDGMNNTLSSIGTLGQNSPNPVRNSTRIAYNIPSGAGKAQLLLTDNLGKILQLTKLDGSGNINLNTASLSSGVYNYSLVVDGKTVETKKMTVVRN